MNWWLIAGIAILAVNAPLAVLLFSYRDLTPSDKVRIAGFSPNQFFFQIVFFPVAALLTVSVADEAHKFALYMLAFGLAFGAFVAWADDKYNFRGIYSFLPKTASKLASLHNSFTTVMDRFAGDDRQAINDVISGAKTHDALAARNIQLDEDEVKKLQSMRKRLVRATQYDWKKTDRVHKAMRKADFLELTLAVAIAFLLVTLTGYSIYKSLSKENVVHCAAAAAAFFPWIGLHLYSQQEINQVTGRQPTGFPAILLVSFPFLLLILLFVYAFVDKGKWIGSLLGVVSALIGFGTIGTTIVSPAIAREWFGYKARWPTLVILAVAVVTFFVIWMFLLLQWIGME